MDDRADSLDSTVRGRFAKEISLPVPDAPSRARILQLLSQSLKLSPAIDFKVLGQQTPGFVGSDIKALVAEAGMVAVARIVKQFEDRVGTTATDLNSTYSHASGMTEEVTGEGEQALISGGGAPAFLSMTDIESLIKQYIFSSSFPSTYTVIEPDHNTPTPTDNTLVEPTLSPTPTTTNTTIESLLQVQANQSALNMAIIQSLYITQADFLVACKSIQPSAKREGNMHFYSMQAYIAYTSYYAYMHTSLMLYYVLYLIYTVLYSAIHHTILYYIYTLLGFAVVPDVTWSDVGALSEIREELLHHVLGM